VWWLGGESRQASAGGGVPVTVTDTLFIGFFLIKLPFFALMTTILHRTMTQNEPIGFLVVSGFLPSNVRKIGMGWL